MRRIGLSLSSESIDGCNLNLHGRILLVSISVETAESKEENSGVLTFNLAALENNVSEF